MPVSHKDVFHSFEGIGGAGLPITLLFPDARVDNVRAELRRGGKEGKPVAFLLSWPGKPAADRYPDNYKCITLIPRRPLRTRTVYWVRVSYTHARRDGVREWTFRTGSR